MRDFPIAVRFDAYVQLANRDETKADLEVPYGIKLLSGGPISKKVSYYFYFYISERGEVAGVEDIVSDISIVASKGITYKGVPYEDFFKDLKLIDTRFMSKEQKQVPLFRIIYEVKRLFGYEKNPKESIM